MPAAQQGFIPRATRGERLNGRVAAQERWCRRMNACPHPCRVRAPLLSSTHQPHSCSSKERKKNQTNKPHLVTSLHKSEALKKQLSF